MWHVLEPVFQYSPTHYSRSTAVKALPQWPEKAVRCSDHRAHVLTRAAAFQRPRASLSCLSQRFVAKAFLSPVPWSATSPDAAGVGDSSRTKEWRGHFHLAANRYVRWDKPDKHIGAFSIGV